MSDPIETIIDDALEEAGIERVRDPDPRTLGLDFYLPDYCVFIECKAFHSPRISDQMSRAKDVIAIQGRDAARLFADSIRKHVTIQDVARAAILRIVADAIDNHEFDS